MFVSHSHYYCHVDHDEETLAVSETQIYKDNNTCKEHVYTAKCFLTANFPWDNCISIPLHSAHRESGLRAAPLLAKVIQ